MPVFFSASEGGFFDDSLHATLPRDATAITQGDYEELLRLQSEGYRIVVQNGRPVAVRPPDPGPVQVRKLTALEFRNRFTPEEKGRLTLEASRGLERGDPTLQVFLDDLASAGEVDLDDPRTIGGVRYCVDQNLITPRRADAILA